MIAVACIDLGQRLAAFNAALDQVAPGTEGDCRHALLREGEVVRPVEASRFGAGIRRVAATQFLALAHQHVEQAQLGDARDREVRSEEHTSELQSLMRISYAVFCLTK